MATLIGDYGASHSAGFHTMIATQGLPYSQQRQDSTSPYRSNSHSRDSTPRRQSSTRPHSPSRYPVQVQKEWEPAVVATERSGASRLPSPPDSSSPSGSAGSASRSDDDLKAQTQAATQYGQSQISMDSSAQQSAQRSTPAPSLATTHVNPAIPSPASDAGQQWSSTGSAIDPPLASAEPEQTTIRIRNLAHIQTLARTQMMGGPGVNDPPLQAMKYEISDMPIGDVIEMVAALLTKITTTNDQQHDALSRNAFERNASHVKQAQAQNEGSATEHSMSPLSSSVLAFHGKNVPAITILSYLSRIHKYCPTTYEVFLSLLVYFDRMTERVNDMVMKAEESKKFEQPQQPAGLDVPMKDDVESTHSDDADEDLVDADSDDEQDATARSSAGVEERGSGPSGSGTAHPEAPTSAASQPTFFVVDSFNIHRLIIAGVTCASKFFSDVFYTNSRYAKVCFGEAPTRTSLSSGLEAC